MDEQTPISPIDTQLPVNPQPTLQSFSATPPTSSQSHVLPILLSVLITTLVIVGGYFGYQYFHKSSTPVSSTILPTSIPTITNTPPLPSPINQNSQVPSDWKTYTNKTFGVSFQYPVNYDVYIDTTLSELSLAEITDDMAKGFNIDKVNNESLATFIKNNSEYKKTDFMIGNQKGSRFQTAGEQSGDFIYLTIGTSNYIFKTELLLLFDDSPFSQILSTFKFINQ